MKVLDVKVTVESKTIERALRAAPHVMKRNLSRGVSRATQEVAREAKRLAPKAETTLTNSIKALQPHPLMGEVVSGADYSAMVEEGTEAGGRPSLQTMMDWIRVRGITPNDPNMDIEDLAFLMRRSIAAKGTKAQPFMAPAFEKKESRVHYLIRRAAAQGMREAGLL